VQTPESRLEGGLKSTSTNKSFHETEDRKGLGEEECRLFDTFLEDAQRAYEAYRTQRMLQHCRGDLAVMAVRRCVASCNLNAVHHVRVLRYLRSLHDGSSKTGIETII
jgi:hypothetical protein